MKTKRRLTLVVLLFVTTLLVGAAFASANGSLFFNGTVRINNVHTVQEARLEFTSARIFCIGQATAAITADNALTFSTTLNFHPDHAWPTVMSQIDFQVENTGNVAVEILNFDYHFDGNQIFGVTLWGENGHVGYSIPSDIPIALNLIVEPGEVISGRILYNPLISVPVGDFETVVLGSRFALNYQQAR